MSPAVDNKLKDSATIILATQLIGMFFMGASTVVKSPLSLTIVLNIGSILTISSVIFWLFLVGRELTRSMRIIDRISWSKKSNK